MAVRTRITPIAKTIDLIVEKTLSPDAQKQAVAGFARGVIAEADSTNNRVLGRVPPRTITVDGRKGAPLTDVKPDGGSIVVEYELITDVLVWIGDALRSRSPVQSGAYRDGWTLLADGEEVGLADDVPPADEYTFVNNVPYARKIEVGLTESGRAFVIQVPNRIAERTATDAAAKFGNIAKIRSAFISLDDGYALKNDAISRARPGRRRRIRSRAGSAITYPAVVVSLKSN
ncbi:MAG: hypothetical protein J0H40_17710 [Rhizobiales bacterium]|nr:hypothetical protein [Hyphomicrobiales bacterium]